MTNYIFDTLEDQPKQINQDKKALHSDAKSPLKQAITVAYGDGIGPEIMRATLKILDAAGARIEPEVIEIGEHAYHQGHTSGITPQGWDSLRRTQVFLKAPITTPTGKGFKSLNVTIRKTLGLYANVRPCVSYAPFIKTLHPDMDVVIVRENEEDLYAGIEHQHTDEVVQCLKLITRPGCEKIIRYAFEYAREHGRHKVTCMVKDNIMKMTDGLFYKIFEEIGKQYPDIEKERYIIDIGAARLATQPGKFDVIVTTNLYGDIISDIAAELSGSVGLAGSANIGEKIAMFEAIHGSAPDIAQQNIANPSGLLLAAVMMLVHIGQAAIASKIHNAWLCTIEAGIHTVDLKSPNTLQLVGTDAFAQAVIARLGQTPSHFKTVQYQNRTTASRLKTPVYERKKPAQKQLLGIDVFIHDAQFSPEGLASQIKNYETENLKLEMITNRGVKVWPQGFPETFCTDHWRCRFTAAIPEQSVSAIETVLLLQNLVQGSMEVIKTENLYSFDGQRGFALGQGQ